MKKFIIILIPFIVSSQDKINGTVMESFGVYSMPITGANVIWEGTTIGSVTDIEGNFSLKYDSSYSKLVISYVGYKTRIIEINNPNEFIHVLLDPSDQLDEVKLNARKRTSSISYIESQNITMISSDELLKAACCNLSESFETNPSIDVNFSDAISGTKQIKMLGLTSPYILITSENIPNIRGRLKHMV